MSKEKKLIKKNSPKREDVQKTLNQRGENYGKFPNQAKISQAIKEALRAAPKWDSLDDDMKEAFEMVAHKMARTLNGKKTLKDNFRDGVGYLQLVLNRLNEEFPGQE